ncbi:arylacetamide deacetylase-like 3, partial [Liasis olivaceus]
SLLWLCSYRLAPEHLFPAQWEDCLTATTHFMKHAEDHGVDPSQIIIGGDSSGGNYTTVVAEKLREQPDLPKLRAQVLIYPYLQAMDFNLPSYQQNCAVPLLLRQNMLYYALQYINRDSSLLEDVAKGCHVPDEMRLKYRKRLDADNIPEKFKRRGYKRIPLAPFKRDIYDQLAIILQPSFSPLFAEDSVIQQLPETFIVSCEYDIFRDDSLLYKELLEQHGVKITWFHAEKGFHGLLNIFDFGFSDGLEMMDKTVEFLKGL